MTDSLEPRVIEMESRIAHYERLAEDLSAVMAEQGRTLDVLNAQVRRLAERLADLEAAATRLPPDDRPPPHY